MFIARLFSCAILFVIAIFAEDKLLYANPANESVFDVDQVVVEIVPEQKNKKVLLIQSAQSFIGMKYKTVDTLEPSIDCSLYTQSVFKAIGIYLPRSADEQSKVGVFIEKDKLEIGDLLFFSTYKKDPSHVGIYIGNNKMIHASFKRKEVVVDDLGQDYYQKRFLFAKRQNI